MTIRLSLAALLVPLALAPAPATAQPRAIPIYVYGNQPCPRETVNNAVVCKRVTDKSEQFRIPQDLRAGGALAQRESWTNKAQELETEMATGTNSCSGIGPGGQNGCLAQQIRAARAIRAEDEKAVTAPLR